MVSANLLTQLLSHPQPETYTHRQDIWGMVEEVPPPRSRASQVFKPQIIHQLSMNEWYVESGETKNKGYLITRVHLQELGMFRWVCDCTDFAIRRVNDPTHPYCKHIYTVYEHFHTAQNEWVKYPYDQTVITELNKLLTKYPDLAYNLYDDMPEFAEYVLRVHSVNFLASVPKKIRGEIEDVIAY